MRAGIGDSPSKETLKLFVTLWDLSLAKTKNKKTTKETYEYTKSHTENLAPLGA